jgi:hypothetical protein
MTRAGLRTYRRAAAERERASAAGPGAKINPVPPRPRLPVRLQRHQEGPNRQARAIFSAANRGQPQRPAAPPGR